MMDDSEEAGVAGFDLRPSAMTRTSPVQARVLSYKDHRAKSGCLFLADGSC